MQNIKQRITHLVSLQHFQKLHINDFGYYSLKANYSNFLDQIVSRGMFVPCDLDGNILEKIGTYKHFDPDYKHSDETIQYYKSTQRVLFKGWKYNFQEECLELQDDLGVYSIDFEDIEGMKLSDLLEEKFELTNTALSQIYDVEMNVVESMKYVVPKYTFKINNKKIAELIEGQSPRGIRRFDKRPDVVVLDCLEEFTYCKLSKHIEFLNQILNALERK